MSEKKGFGVNYLTVVWVFCHSKANYIMGDDKALDWILLIFFSFEHSLAKHISHRTIHSYYLHCKVGTVAAYEVAFHLLQSHKFFFVSKVMAASSKTFE